MNIEEIAPTFDNSVRETPQVDEISYSSATIEPNAYPVGMGSNEFFSQPNQIANFDFTPIFTTNYTISVDSEYQYYDYSFYIYLNGNLVGIGNADTPSTLTLNASYTYRIDVYSEGGTFYLNIEYFTSPISVGTEISTFVNNTGGSFYSFIAPVTGEFNFTVSTLNPQTITLQLLTYQGGILVTKTMTGSSISIDGLLQLYGYYYLRVNSTTNFFFDLSVSKLSQQADLTILNTGTILNEGSSFDLFFNNIYESDFQLVLNGPPMSDFSLSVSLSNGTFLASSVNSSYPELLDISLPEGDIIITVTSISGTGDFSVELRRIAHLGYNSGVTIGSEKTFLWFNATVDNLYGFYLTDGYWFTISKLDGSSIYVESNEVVLTTGEYIIGVYNYLGSIDFDLEITLIAHFGENLADLEFTGDEHWFRLENTMQRKFNFTLTGPVGTDFDLYVRDLGGNIIFGLNDVSYPEEGTVLLPTGTYNIQIYSYNGSGIATFEVLPFLFFGLTHGDLSGYGDIHTYIMELPMSFQFDITLEVGFGVDFDLYIYNLNEVLLYSSTGFNWYENINNVFASGKYFVKVQSNGGSGYYGLTLSYVAQSLSVGENTGTFSGNGDNVVYVMPLRTGEYHFNLSGPVGTDFDFRILDPYNQVLYLSNSYTYPEELNINLDQGNYALEIWSYSGSGTYVMNVTALVLDLNTGSNLGHLNGQYDYDEWRINVQNAGVYEIILDGAIGSDFDLYIYNSDHTQLLFSSIDLTYPEAIVTYLNVGFYRVIVRSYWGSGDYDLKFRPENFDFIRGHNFGYVEEGETKYYDYLLAYDVNGNVPYLGIEIIFRSSYGVELIANISGYNQEFQLQSTNHIADYTLVTSPRTHFIISVTAISGSGDFIIEFREIYHYSETEGNAYLYMVPGDQDVEFALQVNQDGFYYPFINTNNPGQWLDENLVLSIYNDEGLFISDISESLENDMEARSRVFLTSGAYKLIIHRDDPTRYHDVKFSVLKELTQGYTQNTMYFINRVLKIDFESTYSLEHYASYENNGWFKIFNNGTLIAEGHPLEIDLLVGIYQLQYVSNYHIKINRSVKFVHSSNNADLGHFSGNLASSSQVVAIDFPNLNQITEYALDLTTSPENSFGMKLYFIGNHSLVKTSENELLIGFNLNGNLSLYQLVVYSVGGSGDFNLMIEEILVDQPTDIVEPVTSNDTETTPSQLTDTQSSSPNQESSGSSLNSISGFMTVISIVTAVSLIRFRINKT